MAAASSVCKILTQLGKTESYISFFKKNLTWKRTPTGFHSPLPWQLPPPPPPRGWIVAAKP